MNLNDKEVSNYERVRALLLVIYGLYHQRQYSTAQGVSRL
jgi:hypothetical protein